MTAGYAHPEYARSLSEFGELLELPRSGAWILKRRIPNSDLYDAMGLYPLTVCRDWSKLREDLDDIQASLVCVSLVADPFGDYSTEDLEQAFDLVYPFKEHYVADLSLPIEEIISDHHQRNIRKSQKMVHVDTCTTPSAYLDDWLRLYEALIDRHDIKGIRAFSKEAFAHQLKVPGTVLFAAKYKDETIGASIVYFDGCLAYVHLSAFSPDGYKKRVSYAIKAEMFEYCKKHGIKLIDIGAGAGINQKEKDGLTKFKEGWANSTRPAYFCGRIFQRGQYERLVERSGKTETDFFPAYREGEFN